MDANFVLAMAQDVEPPPMREICLFLNKNKVHISNVSHFPFQ